jgi:AcrR family transcriptional regulator
MPDPFSSVAVDRSLDPRPRREVRKEETRSELTAAAARVFARDGFHRASMQEIAREAGWSTGAIYHHFSGKDELFLAVYEDYATTRVREWEHIRMHGEGDFPQRMRAYADQWMARLRDDSTFMALLLEFLPRALREPTLREALANRAAAGREALARIIKQTAEEQATELPMPAELIATALRELGTGLAAAKLADPDGIPDRLFGDFVEQFFTLATERQHSLGVTTPRGQR